MNHTRISPSVSERIRLVRVLCILGVVYVHTPPYVHGVPGTLAGVDGLIWLIRETIGRTSVPLLSVISGYLAIRLAESRGWLRQMGRKVDTLVVPLLLWNLIALAKDFALSSGRAFPSLGQLPQELLGIAGFPHLTPLYFLRDVFVCYALLPLFVALLRRACWPTLALLLVNALMDFDRMLFTNSHIPVFFAAGLAIGIGAFRVQPLLARERLLGVLALGLLALCVTTPFYAADGWASVFGDRSRSAMLLVERFCGVVLFWLLATWAAGRRQLAERVMVFEPMIFFVFCAHPFIVGLGWMVIHALGGRFGDLAHLSFFVLAPLICLFPSLLAVLLLSSVAPRLLRLLLGGRSPTEAELRRLRQPWRLEPRKRSSSVA